MADPTGAAVLARSMLARSGQSGPITELVRGRIAVRMEQQNRATLVAAEQERRATLVATERERRATLSALIKDGVAGAVITDRDPHGRVLTVRIPAPGCAPRSSREEA
ncbi:hypothetical protein GCM10009839_21320 [Catenulispora yoronensis]|uniref:Uncharacterized protein n=1 Tax=Catenulispora yoronensis TaxID=450799 RepID=A0ABN2TXA3_9ACTN